MRDDDDDRCSPRRCFLACLGCGCFCLALPTVAGLFSGGTSVGAAEHLQEVRSIVLNASAGRAAPPHAHHAHSHHAHHNATRGSKPPT